MQNGGIDSDQWRKWMVAGAGSLGIDVDDQKIGLLEAFANELLEANRIVNLTRVTDPLEVAEHMMIDSMAPGKFIPSGARVLDIGTGAGLPGIPLKIARPDLSLMLVDSKRKKINFVRFAIRQLGLEGIGAVQARVEDLVKEEGGRFDVVVSKAVSSMDQLMRLGFPFLKKGGMLIAMKGRGYLSELEAVDLDVFGGGGRIRVDVEKYRLPLLEIDRTLVIVRWVDGVIPLRHK